MALKDNELEMAREPKRVYVFAYVNDDGELSHFTLTTWDHKDKSYIKIAEFDVIPADHIPEGWDWRPAAVKSIDERITEVRAELQNKLTELANLRMRVLQLTYDAPQLSPNGGDDIPF